MFADTTESGDRGVKGDPKTGWRHGYFTDNSIATHVQHDPHMKEFQIMVESIEDESVRRKMKGLWFVIPWANSHYKCW